MAIQSPCIKACKIDDRSALCEGCGRSIEEVMNWARMSNAERATIMSGLAERMSKHFPAAKS
ncbi:MAG: DUF1289 domain-containing protein [Cohaesibacter sp.]|nr:DUF1289 domain-containing protein [Cohaesibacter sp.]